jgi:hypothetical protein
LSDSHWCFCRGRIYGTSAQLGVNTHTGSGSFPSRSYIKKRREICSSGNPPIGEEMAPPADNVFLKNIYNYKLIASNFVLNITLA